MLEKEEDIKMKHEATAIRSRSEKHEDRDILQSSRGIITNNRGNKFNIL